MDVTEVEFFNLPILYLGDAHLGCVQTSKLTRLDLFDNVFMNGNDYFETGESVSVTSCLIQTLKTRYESFIEKEKIVPKIVVFQGGSYDLTRVSTINVVISSILRFVKHLKKDGVKVIVICALVPRDIPPPFNNKIKKVNDILAAKLRKTERVYFLQFPIKTPLCHDNYIPGETILLKSEVYSKFWNLFKNIICKIKMDIAADVKNEIEESLGELESLQLNAMNDNKKLRLMPAIEKFLATERKHVNNISNKLLALKKTKKAMELDIALEELYSLKNDVDMRKASLDN